MRKSSVLLLLAFLFASVGTYLFHHNCAQYYLFARNTDPQLSGFSIEQGYEGYDVDGDWDCSTCSLLKHFHPHDVEPYASPCHPVCLKQIEFSHLAPRPPPVSSI